MHQINECKHVYESGKCTFCGAMFPEEEVKLENFTGGTAVYKRPMKDRESGLTTSYYSFPQCTETKDIIRYKKMSHSEGEMFCALMRLHNNGEYKRNLEKILYYAQSELKYLEDESRKST